MSRISPPGWFIVEKLNEQIIGSNNNTDINIKSVKNDLQNRINNIAMGPTVAIGSSAGITGQQSASVAIGPYAGEKGQHCESVAIGNAAGRTGQGESSVAIGDNAGYYQQGINSVAIGPYAGNTGQGNYSIAIGYHAGKNRQPNNSIILNASHTTPTTPTDEGFFVHPVKGVTGISGTQYKQLYYDTNTCQIVS